MRGAPLVPEVGAGQSPCNDQFVDSSAGRWKSLWIEVSQGALGFIETADQEQTPDVEVARMGRIHQITVLFEC